MTAPRDRLGLRATLALLAFGALVGAAVELAATAKASPSQDQQFYTLLASSGITPGARAIPIAHTICASVWAGVSPWSWVSAVYYQNAVATWDDATNFVGDAIEVFCPPASNTSAQTGWAV